AEGDKFFEGTLKDAALPGKIQDTDYTTLKGKLVKTVPATNPKQLILLMDTNQNVSSDSEGEVTLTVDGGLRGKADPGTEIELSGVAKAFSKEPFMLTFEVEKDQLKGWPAQAAPATKKATGGGAKKGVPTKKK